MLIVDPDEFFTGVGGLKIVPIVVEGRLIDHKRINRRTTTSSQRSCPHHLERRFEIVHPREGTNTSHLLFDRISVLPRPETLVDDDICSRLQTGECHVDRKGSHPDVVLLELLLRRSVAKYSHHPFVFGEPDSS